MRDEWDRRLQQHLKGLIKGYALLDRHNGQLLSFSGNSGEFSAELWRVDDRPSHLAQKLLQVFNTNGTPGQLEVCSQKLTVVQRSEGSLCAVSRGKHLGMTAHYLPSGILVTVFGQPNLPQVVVPQVEAVCDVLRQP